MIKYVHNKVVAWLLCYYHTLICLYGASPSCMYLSFALSLAHVWRSYVCCYSNNLNLFTQNESFIYGRRTFFSLSDSLSTFNFKCEHTIFCYRFIWLRRTATKKNDNTHCNIIRTANTYMCKYVSELCAIITRVCYLNETKAIIQISWMRSVLSVESNLINSFGKKRIFCPFFIVQEF